MKQYIVLDLEMCGEPKYSDEKQTYRGLEIIQIGAVRLNESYDIIDTYCAYVQPQFTKINSHIENLTGIKQVDVEGAKLFHDAINDFLEWIGEEPVTMVSWSDCDQTQLTLEMNRKHLTIPRLKEKFKDWTDAQVLFGKKVKKKELYNLQYALIVSDIVFKEGAHDALVDAHNTALLFKKLNGPGEFKFNEYYSNSDTEQQHLGYDLGSLLKNVDLKKE